MSKQRLYVDIEQVVYDSMIEFYRGFDCYTNSTEKEIIESVLENAYQQDTEQQRMLLDIAEKEAGE